MMNSSSLFMLGKVVKAHGTKGGFLLDIGSFLKESMPKDKLFLRYPGHQWVPYRIDDIRPVLDKSRTLFFVRLEEIHTRTIAESLRNHEVMTDQKPEALEEEPSTAGYEVVRPDKTVLGEVVDIIETPAYEVFVVVADKGRVLIPDVPEYVTNICHDTRVLMVQNTDNLESLADSPD
ncbi:hypothetical protein QLX67_09265 [Balneolaceae bacterium ANBcel3]|nr:hypothetical protein [Balneolaceae bacterium ANBcel3]